MLKVLLAECLGTMIFFLCILSSTEVWAVGIGLMAAAHAFGKISGGHFNTTLSIVKYFKGELDIGTLGLYIVAQVIGGILALLFYQLNATKAGIKSK